MKNKKRLSPFEELHKFIENELFDQVFECQLLDLYNFKCNSEFIRGRIATLRYILAKANCIYNRRWSSEELQDLDVILSSTDEELYKFITKKRE